MAEDEKKCAALQARGLARRHTTDDNATSDTRSDNRHALRHVFAVRQAHTQNTWARTYSQSQAKD